MGNLVLSKPKAYFVNVKNVAKQKSKSHKKITKKPTNLKFVLEFKTLPYVVKLRRKKTFVNGNFTLEYDLLFDKPLKQPVNYVKEVFDTYMDPSGKLKPVTATVVLYYLVNNEEDEQTESECVTSSCVAEDEEDVIDPTRPG